MKIKSTIPALITVMAGFAVTAGAQSGLIGTIGDSPFSTSVNIYNEQQLYMSFTTGNYSAQMSSLDIWTGAASDTGALFHVDLGSVTGAGLGTTIGYFTGPSVPALNSEVTYDAPDITLQPDTSYWLIFSDDSATGVPLVTSSGTTASAGYTAPDWALGDPSYPGDTVFTYVSGTSTTFHPEAGYTPYFDLVGVEAPEPTSLTLVAMGGLGLCLIRRKK